MTTQLEQAWELAKQRFAAVGIDVEEALRQLDRLPVSMHCWQGDDTWHTVGDEHLDPGWHERYHR